MLRNDWFVLHRFCCKPIKAVPILHLWFTVLYPCVVYGCEPQRLWNKNPLAVASRLFLESDLGVAFRGMGCWGTLVFFPGLTKALTNISIMLMEASQTLELPNK